jgi:hypothetical protein
VARFVPDHVTQADDSRCQWANCWASVGAWLAAGSSGGTRTPAPTFFRYRAAKGGNDCSTGGLADMIRGLTNMGLWGRAKYRSDVPVDEMREMLRRRSGALVALETDFGSYPDKDSCQSGFAGYHAIGVVAGAGTDKHRGEVRTMDPLCRDYRWVDIDGVLASALEYNRDHQEAKGTLDCIVVLPPFEEKA